MTRTRSRVTRVALTAYSNRDGRMPTPPTKRIRAKQLRRKDMVLCLDVNPDADLTGCIPAEVTRVRRPGDQLWIEFNGDGLSNTDPEAYAWRIIK